jgi:hypothetical protein
MNPTLTDTRDSDRRVRLKITAQREADYEQLVNDLAEDMPMCRWTRDDLIGCIGWQQDALCAAALSKATLRLEILQVITGDLDKKRNRPGMPRANNGAPSTQTTGVESKRAPGASQR